MIRNAIHTLKRGGSSVDFQADNLFHLEAAHQDMTVAVKNCSDDAFFMIRDVVFDIVSEKVKNMFRARGEREVEAVAVTLDKVTVQRVSYTVLLTYFFWQGVIHIVLNKLMVMKEDEYDSEGTASAVVASLTESMGISRIRLRDILVHFAYDGVYATTEQRVGGGGSLNLTKFVALELGVEEGDITGTWDVAHQLQLIWHKALKKNSKVMKTVKVFFDAMSEFSLGKNSTIFHSKARDIKALVLAVKGYQETRFVACLLRGLATGLRNLPTMCHILQEAFEEACLNFNNTDGKILQQKLKSLKSPETILMAVGLCKLLEVYAGVSLEAQHAKHFPTQVWARIRSAQEEVLKLSEQWTWGEEPLPKAGLEAPKRILDKLKDEGIYEPKLTESQVVKRQAEMRSTGLLQEGEKVADLFKENEQVVPLAGQIVIEEEVTEEKVKQVEITLSNYAKTIHEEWMKRHIQDPLEARASSLLGEEALKKDIEMGSEAFEDDEESDDWSREKKQRFRKLKNLLELRPDHISRRFDPSVVFPGLESWLRFLKEKVEEKTKGDKEKEGGNQVEERGPEGHGNKEGQGSKRRRGARRGRRARRGRGERLSRGVRRGKTPTTRTGTDRTS